MMKNGHDRNLQPFRAGDEVQWDLKGHVVGREFLRFGKIEAYNGESVLVEKVYWEYSDNYKGWLCDIRCDGKLGRGFTTDWFKFSKHSTLKKYFND